MARALMGFFERFMIKDYLNAQTDGFEIAKIRLTLDFLISFLLITIFVVPTAFINKHSLVFSFNFILPVPFIVCLAILKYGRSYKLSAIFFSISLFVLITINSLMANGSLSIIITVWYCVVILFSNLIISNRVSGYFMIVTLLAVSGIVALKLAGFKFYNPTFNESNSLFATPFVLLFSFIVMYRLLSEYTRLMREAIDKIIAANKAKGDILRIVAHDLRNPIGAVRTICYLLQNDVSLIAEKKKNSTIPENIDLIDNASNNAMTIIDDLTEFAEIEERKSFLKIEMHKLAPVLESIIKLYKARARQKKISLKITYASKRIVAKIDQKKFSRAIENLISNAIKFTYKNGKVEIKLAIQDDDALISVSDNGIGIPENLQQAVFNKFTDARRSGTEGEKTIGLGLSITKDIITKHKGKIWCESTPGNGTTFFVTIPAFQKPKVGSEQEATTS
jgi:signal transduction histidine kinase